MSLQNEQFDDANLLILVLARVHTLLSKEKKASVCLV